MEEEIMENTLYFGRKTEFFYDSPLHAGALNCLFNKEIRERDFTSYYKITGFGLSTDRQNNFRYYFETEEHKIKFQMIL